MWEKLIEQRKESINTGADSNSWQSASWQSAAWQSASWQSVAETKTVEKS